MGHIRRSRAETPQALLLNVDRTKEYYRALYELESKETDISGGGLLLRQQVVL